jgi:beta-lactamase regulating signal transducer with metallopeptidase domain
MANAPASAVTVTLMGLWAAGVLFGVVRLARQARFAQRLVAALVPVVDPTLESTRSRLCAALGLRREPALKTGAAIPVPMLLGVRRPTIALPPGTSSSTDAGDLELILAHELAHIRRRDLLWAWLPILAQTVFFFHPLVWLARREFALAQEIACDELAVRCSRTSLSAYGAVLLQVATRGRSRGHTGLVIAAMAESFDTIHRRIHAMKQFGSRSSKGVAVSMLVVAGLSLAGLIPWKVEAQELPKAGGAAIQAGPYALRITDVQRASGSGALGGGGGFGGGGGAGGGFAAGGPGGSVQRSFSFGPNGQSFQSNLTVTFDVQAKDPDTLTLLAGINGGAHAVDNLGNPVTGAEMASISFPMQRKPGSRPESVMLMLPDPKATNLRSLEAELLVITGAVRTIRFPADEVKPGATKREGKVAVTIESVRETAQGTEVAISYEAPQADAPVNPRDMIQRLRMSHSNISVELQDSNGRVSGPRTSAGGSGGGGGFGGGFNFAGAGGARSFQFGNGPGEGNGANRIQQTYSFAPPRDGAKAASLNFRVVERQGEDKKIPFKIENIALPK